MHPCRRRAGQLSRRAHSLRARHRPHAHHRPRRGHDGLRFLSYAVQGQGLAVAVRAMKIALLDDYQGVALACADWPGIVPQAEVTVFRDTIADADALVARLRDFRSEERRVGNECGRTCISRWSPD